MFRIGLTQQRRHFYALNGAQERGNIVHIIFADANLFFYGLGQRANGQIAPGQKLHVLGDPGLQTQLGQRLGVEDPLIPAVNISTRSCAVTGHIKGVKVVLAKRKQPVSVETPT